MRRLIPPALLLFALNAAASITGTLVHVDGKPVAGATVRVYPAETAQQARKRLVSPKPEREALVTVTTKDDGAFSVDPKGNVAVDLVIEVAGRARTSMLLQDGIDAGAVVLRDATIRTVKVTAGGKPVANALVVFSPSRTTRTDASGNFDSMGEFGGTFIHPDYAIEQLPIGNVSEVKLQKGVALKGRVTGANGPVAHAAVMLNGYQVAESGDDGAFTVAHAPAGWRSLVAVAGNNVGVAVPTKAALIDLRLRPGVVFSGSVRDSVTDAPVAGALVMLADNTLRDQASALADAKGRFTFDPLPPGSYNILGQHWAYWFEGSQTALGESLTRNVAARPLARVRGRVVDEGRKPVAGALVGSPQDTAKRTITDADGKFVLRVTPETRFMRVTATKHGYAAGVMPQRTFKPGETVNDVVITMPQGFPLELRVIDHGRHPVAGAVVSLTVRDEAGPMLPAACDEPGRDACSVSDAKGSVTYRIVEGEYWYSVRGGERMKVVPLNGQAALTSRSSPYTIEVEAGVSVSGKVVFADGTPAAGAEVNVAGRPGERRETADAAGLFTIDALPATKTIITATTADHRLVTQAVEVTPPAQNLTLTLPRGGRIEGRVVERGSSRPVTDFSVAVVRRGGGGGGMGSPANTMQPVHADDGAFVVENVAAGNVTLSVSANGYVAAMRGDINVEEGGTARGIEVQLERGARVTGRVTSAGKPVAGVNVSVGGPGGPSARNVTDTDGEYAIEGLAAGERIVDFRKTGYLARRKTLDVVAAKDARLDVKLDRGAELRGRVVDAGGAPVGGATVSATATTYGSEDARAVSDGDGSFVLEGLPDARYIVTARKRGLVTAMERDVQVPSTTPLTLTLRTGGTISGRVIGLPPGELAGVAVTAFGNQSAADTQTDVNGAFTLRGVTDGQVTVSASIPGANRRSQPKVISVENGSAPPVELEFAEGFTVHGRVVFNGTPLDQGSISFGAAGPNRTSGYGRVVAGSYEISGLAAGDYRLLLTAGEVRYDEKLTVSGSMVHDIDIRGAAVRGRVVDAATGAPIAGAAVNLRARPAAGGRTALSDSDGHFVLNAVADGIYDVIGVLPPYAAASQQVSVSVGSAPDVELRLERGTPVLVKVVDASTGKLLSMVSASVHDMKNLPVAGNQQSDEDGIHFYLRPGEYVLNAFAPGYVPQSRIPFSVPSPEVRVPLERAGVLALRANATHHVRVMGADSQRVAFAGNVVPGQMMTLETLAPGAYVVQVLGSDGKAERSIPAVVIAGQTVTVPLD